MLWVGLVGPFTNFALMVVGRARRPAVFAGHHDLPRRRCLDLPARRSRSRTTSRSSNLFLGIFNLLPIPPLDGSSLLERVLPESWLPHWYRFRPYGMLVLFALVFFTPILQQGHQSVRGRLYDFIVQ